MYLKCFSICAVVIFAFISQSFNVINHENSSLSEKVVQKAIPDINRPKKKLRFALRHSGTIDPQTGQPRCVCPSCNIPACPCPLGICISLGIVDASNELTPIEVELQNANELGTAAFGLIDDNHILIAFDQITGYDDGSNNKIIELESNYSLSQSISQNLGKNSITLNSGTYPVAFDGWSNGYIIVDCQTN